MTDPVAIVEQRGREAWKTLEGPDYEKIIRDVAAEFQIPESELREHCRNRWTQDARGA